MEHRTTMPEVWKVLVRMLADSAPGQDPSATSMLKGSRKYQERGFPEYLTSTIHSNRAQVGGGSVVHTPLASPRSTPE